MEQQEGYREWYVRLENMYLNDSCVGYKRIIATGSTVSSLTDSILVYYQLPAALRERIRIGSSPFRMDRLDRLDRLDMIPEEVVFVSVEFR